jgi:hypothetical protein
VAVWRQASQAQLEAAVGYAVAVVLGQGGES